MKKRIGVLMGGPSCERDISIKSGKAVLTALNKLGIDSVSIELVKEEKETDYKDYVIREIKNSGAEAVFIALHGKFGEDGEVQSILESMDFPFTGSGSDASRNGMNKIKTKSIFNARNIPVPRHIIIYSTDLDKAVNSHVYFKELGRPVVIKPSGEGSSIGMSIVDSEDGFLRAIKDAFKYGEEIIIEEYIAGREITVGVLKDKPLPIVEIVPKNKFFDFEAKYQKGLTEYKVPALMDESIYKNCQELGLSAHKALNARAFSRVDMILKDDRYPVVLEVNTIPGLTETSLLPKAAMATGINFEQLVLRIMESTLW